MHRAPAEQRFAAPHSSPACGAGNLNHSLTPCTPVPWRVSALTTFLLTARSDFIDTTATGSGGALSRQVGLEARHAFRRHLIGMAGVRYTVSPYAGIDLTQRQRIGELGFDYYLGRDMILFYLGRDMILFGRFQHIVFESTTPASDYTADIARIGLRVRQ